MTRLVQIQWRRIILLLLAVAFSHPASAQQQYNNVSGYACTRGAATSCQSYAFYRTQGSESTLASIATLFNTSSSGIANVSGIDPGQTTPFPDQTLMYIPLACHCANGTYQASTSHVVAQSETMFIIANSTYEGLTTYQAIEAANPTVNATAMEVGQLLKIPLRCACPSTAQREGGSQLLLSYAIFSGETLSLISGRFNVSVADIEAANNITDPSTLLAFSTLLIPLPALVPLNSSTLAPPPPPPNAPAPTPSPASSTTRAKDPSNTPLYIGIAVGAAGLALAAILACLLCATIARYKKIIREKDDDQSSKRSLMKPSISSSNGDRNTGSSETPGFLVGMTDVLGSDKPAKFSYEELLTATNHFSDENRIQGSVFLGKLNGSFVAIKQMKGSMTDELKILSQVHHGNVVRLVGVCASRSESLYLVYEYAENGSLSDCLHYQIAYPDSSFSRTVGLLSWKLRLQIALDVASGLEYLHNYTKPSLVHKDVKSSNILLDRQFRAKVANFGMAKSAEEDVPGPMMTEHIVGTQGYMAPEYLEHGLVTTRADVFSFGVVLLEILSGREAMFSSNDGEVTHLSATIFDVLGTEDQMAKLAAWVDPRLQNAYPREIAFSAASLAKTCVETDPSKRPDMKEISFALSKLCQASQEWESSNRYSGPGIEAR